MLSKNYHCRCKLARIFDAIKSWLTSGQDISEADYCEFDKLPDVEFAKDEEDYDMRPLGGLNRFRECAKETKESRT